MKAVPLLLFAMSSLSFIVIAPVSIGSSYALKDEDGRFGIVTLENLKGKRVEVTMFIYDEEKKKNQRNS
jgi:hypothetical protein